MSAPPRIARRWDGSIVLTFPYAGELVEGLKAHVPAYARSYDPATRAWTIAAAYAGTARRLMAQVFPDLEEGTAPPPPPREPAGTTDPYSVLHLRPTAPPELVTAAHRVLAKLHHPDAGGSTTAMQAINHAVDAIRGTS